MAQPIPIYCIVAMDQARVIGKDNGLVWNLPEDMRRFKELTSNCTVVMGRKTYDSLPEKFRPLPNRKNIVLSKQTGLSIQGVSVFLSFEDFLKSSEYQSSNKVWIIGGEQIYRATLPYWDEVYLTLVDGEHLGDAYLPEFEYDFLLKDEERKEGFSFRHYMRR